MLEILLTGSSGFLGRFFQQKLEKICKLTSLSRGGADINCNLEGKIPRFRQTFDIVIHSAGKAHRIPRNQIEEQEFYKTNVNGTQNLLKALECSPRLKSFVFISSVAVYGLSHGILINEDSPLLAKDSYGLSKIQAEQLVQEWCKKRNVTCTILRLPLIVGKNAPGNLGALVMGIRKGYYFNIDDGRARKSMILGEDIAKYILKISRLGGIYNLTDGIHPTIHELSHLIALQLGKSKVINISYFFAQFLAIIGDLTGGFLPFNSDKLNKITSTLTFDDSKARAVFQWKPTPVLEGFKIN
jgi:nucleoside-diphosphate-sugar epimerase